MKRAQQINIYLRGKYDKTDSTGKSEIGICKGKGNLWNLKKLPKANAFLLSCQALFERLTKTFGKKTTKKTIIL